jgi:hypothetical protein
MKMMKILGIAALLMLGVCVSYGQKAKAYSQTDEYVYDGRIKQVRGTVTILDHPELGKTPGNGQYIVFQREGCKDCLIAVHSDIDGNYKVFLGPGRYKLIMQWKNCGYAPTEDRAGHNLLADNQEQYLVVKEGYQFPADITFNINLVLSKDK